MLDLVALVSAAAILAVWLIYPLSVALLAALRRQPQPQGDSARPMVSIVLATREEVSAVRRRVEDCLQTAYDPDKIEVIVAWDSQIGDFPEEEIAALDERVRAVRGDAVGGKAAALNAGVRAARGEILVFTDTYWRFNPEAIPHLVAALEDPATGAVSGTLEYNALQQPRSLFGYYWRYERWLRGREAQVHSTVGVSGGIYAMRRSLWTPLPEGLILDDVFVPMRVVLQGYRVAFLRSARAFETRLTTPVQEYGRKVRTLTGVFQLCAWLPAVLVPSRNPIWLQFTFHKLLRLLTPYWALAIAVWLLVAGAHWVAAHPPQAAVLAVLLIIGLIAKPGIRGPIQAIVSQGVLLQAAVITAAVNGVRGRWNVWSK